MSETSVQPTVYGVGAADDANVPFPLDSALPAARAAWALAEAVDESRWSDLNSDVGLLTAWIGPHRDVFDSKVEYYEASSRQVAPALRTLARQIAEGWQYARGQQDRINFARYCEDEAENDGWGENAVEYFGGEDDYGPPPENPPRPWAPDFAPTRDPMYTQFGP
jgi:hypothetical protein